MYFYLIISIDENYLILISYFFEAKIDVDTFILNPCYFHLFQVIVKSGPGTFLSLAVYDNYIFWSDWGRRAILRSNKYTGGDTKILRSDIPHQPMGIIAVANDTNSCKL